MSESREAWSKVGERFGALGDKLKAHGARAVGERSGSGPDQAAVVEALNTLGRAIDQAVSSVTGAVKDPAVRDDAKGALDAMGDALNSTFAEYGDLVGDKVKQTFGRKDDSGSSR